eukprot:Hpha_TRINITY_DN14941_c2_g13::TRINITY_DN14941_c2_g13_i1::g.143533::m.143533
MPRPTPPHIAAAAAAEEALADGSAPGNARSPRHESDAVRPARRGAVKVRGGKVKSHRGQKPSRRGHTDDEGWETVSAEELEEPEPAARAEAEAVGEAGPEQAGEEERRVDKADGRWYTRKEFESEYGDDSKWKIAPRCRELRVDPSDGLGYNLDAFLVAYGETEGRASWDAAEPLPVTRIGVVLDLHYVEVQAKQFALKTSWSPTELEGALERSLNGMVVQRVACDSDPLDWHTGVGEKQVSGKRGLHQRLAEEGYDMRLSPLKRVPKGMRATQGATDIDVCVSVYKMAGAFKEEPEVDCICLFAGDSDFRPLVQTLLDSRRESHGMRCVVVAAGESMRGEYREWLRTYPGAEMLELTDVLQKVAPHVVNFRHGVAEADPGAAAQALLSALESRSGGRDVVLELSNHRGAWGDKEMLALGKAAENSFKEKPELCRAFGELWVHHTAIGDASCKGVLDRLVGAASNLRELHLSDTNVTASGVIALARTAYRARKGGLKDKSVIPLYINAEHIPVHDVATEAGVSLDSIRPMSNAYAVTRGCAFFAPGDYGKVVTIKLGRQGAGKGKGEGKGEGAKGG